MAHHSFPFACMPFARMPFARMPFARMPFARMPFAAVPFAAVPFLALVAGCGHLFGGPAIVTPGPAHDVIVFRDVAVFDGIGPALLPHRDVVVRGGLIDLVVPTGPAIDPSVAAGLEAPLAKGALVVEGAGRTLLPGLIDAHAHVTLIGAPPWVLELPSAERNLSAHLYAGVTTVLDLGGMPRDVAAARRLLDEGGPFPRGYFAGPLVTAEGGYPGAYVERLYPWPLDAYLIGQLTRSVTTPAEARETVAELRALDVDLVKVVVAETPHGAPVIGERALVALTEQAHRRGLKVLAHVDDAAHALLAARAGVDALAHGVHTSLLTEEEARELADSGVAVMPTLLSLERLHQLLVREVRFHRFEEDTEDADLLGSFSEAEIDAYDIDPELEAWLGHVEAHRGDARASLQRLVAAGVPILVGTDANGSPACFPGGIHEEMRLLVDAGVPPLEVLRGATSRPARLVNGPPGLGRIAEGAPADLLLVEGDPLTDITATARIALVVRGGRPIERNPGAR